MSYGPLLLKADRLNAYAGAAITGGQVVVVNGAAVGNIPTVTASAGASASVIGVASDDQPTTGAELVVYTVGVHLLTASGSISAGDPVISATAGAVATISSDTTYTHVIGKALAAATNGNPVPVLLTL